MKTVVTIGLGYIGLPTSALMASNGLSVRGIDINQSVVDTINLGNVHIIEPDLDKIVKRVVIEGKLKAYTKIQKGDVYLIVVPTPFKENFQPDISLIQEATLNIIPLLKSEDLLIIESTSPVGTTDTIRDLIYQHRPELKEKVRIAYCPERVLPGNVLHELVHNDRVIGGIDNLSTECAAEFYRLFVKGELHKTNAKTAEMCKLTENASRDAQIAFANELSLICKEADINVWELIRLANKHPRVNILNPGIGVGGHCIAVDPYFITSKYPNQSILIQTSRKINNQKTEWCLSEIIQIIETYKSQKRALPKIGLLGIAFKPDIDDTRESPALKIAIKLKTLYPNNVLVFEPNVEKNNKVEITPFISENIKTLDVIIKLVNHKQFYDLNFDSKLYYSFASET